MVAITNPRRRRCSTKECGERGRETSKLCIHSCAPIPSAKMDDGSMDGMTSSSPKSPFHPSLSAQTSAISLNRLIVLLVAAAAGVLPRQKNKTIASACFPLTCPNPYPRRLKSPSMPMNSNQPKKKNEKKKTHETVHAPPATVFLQLPHLQIPTECRLTVVLPQKVQV